MWVFAFGKAAHAMATAAVQSLLRSLHQIVGGVVVTPDGAPSPYPTLVSAKGDHPIPGPNSFAAAATIDRIAAGRQSGDVAIVLISGGTTSLIAGPLRGMSADDLARTFSLVLDSSLDIGQMNAVRKRFSRWGGGRLAVALAPAATYCLCVSDVIGDDVSVIGSGPCVPDSVSILQLEKLLESSGLLERLPAAHREYLKAVLRGSIPETPRKTHPAFAHVTTKVIANNATALGGAMSRARERGLHAEIIAQPVVGEAAVAGESIARDLMAAADGQPRLFGKALIWGGETTVTLGGIEAGAGSGGRCQELALAAARTLQQAGSQNWSVAVLAAGTDGRDGATDAAGAVVDHTTWRAIRDGGVDPEAALAAHTSNAALAAADALIPRRASETNVADIVIGLAG